MKDALGSAQSALVLGGTSEIALAIVDKLVADRCRKVVLAGRHPQELDQAAAPLRTRGADVSTVAFDALDTDNHQDVIAKVFADHGDLDLVILAFGVLGSQDLFDDDPAAAARAVTANYTGGVSAGLAVAEQFRRQGHGTLVVLSSVAAERARKSNFVYGSSKAGLDSFAQGLGDALAPLGIQVVVVRPGFVHTRMTAGMESQPFATTPDAVADAVITGLRRGATTIWAPGIVRWVFAVMRHLPRPLWRIVSAR